MKKSAPLAIVTILFAVFLASCTNAQTTGSVNPTSASGMSRSDDGITVIIISDGVDDDEQTQQIPRTYRFPSAETIAKAQDEIRTDARLRSVLQSKSVQLRNVVGVQTAYNGSRIVYVQ